MTKSPVPYYRNILVALELIRQYQPSSLGEFTNDSKSRDAMMMRLQEVGENLARVRAIDEERFRRESPDSWKKLISLRHIISHEYELVRFDVIWRVVTEELPPFERSVNEAITRELAAESNPCGQ
jgi:uncharacterized protein with HEPN domain